MFHTRTLYSEPCDCGHIIRHNNGGNYHVTALQVWAHGRRDTAVEIRTDTRNFLSGTFRIQFKVLHCGCHIMLVYPEHSQLYIDETPTVYCLKYSLNCQRGAEKHDWDYLAEQVVTQWKSEFIPDLEFQAIYNDFDKESIVQETERSKEIV